LDLSSSLSSDSEDIQIVDSEVKADSFSNEKLAEEDKDIPFIHLDNSFNKKKGFSFFKVNRPPSRHKTPPKAVGLEIPVTPHTPPKTQKDYDEYLHTINLKGIGFLINDVATHPVDSYDSDYESFSSSKV
jgi:hypothetical protein